MKFKEKNKHKNKILIFVFLFAVLVLTFAFKAYADLEDENQLIDKYTRIIENSQLMDSIPDEAESYIKDLNKSINLKTIISLSPKDFLYFLKSEIKSAFLKPVRVMATVFGIAAISSLAFGLKSSFMEGSVGAVFSAVSVLSLVGFISPPIIKLITETAMTVKNSCNFILSFIPIMGALIASGGFKIVKAGYTAMLFFFCQIAVSVCSNVFVPIMGMYFALSVTGCLVPSLSFSSITSAIKKVAVWGLNLMATVFVSFLSLQTIVSVSADKLSFKTAKFLVGSFVPAIGTVLSDAVSTAYGCINLIKNTLGGFGVVIVILSFLPIIVKLCLWYFCLNITKELTSVIGAKEISGILNSASFCIGILISICFAVGLVLIVSTTVIMVWVTP